MKESPAGRKKRAANVVRLLKKSIPDRQTALTHTNPLQLLVATILSAQCTDERVNKVTPMLFEKYPTAEALARAVPAELEQVIRSTGFFRSKAKNIIACCRSIVERHHGQVPDTMEELTHLAGVGRKTANVVLGNFFGKAEGIVVDTHVMRLSERLGFSKAQTAEKIETDLMALLPKSEWIEFSNLLIRHGRATCPARSPKCEECVVSRLCPSSAV